MKARIHLNHAALTTGLILFAVSCGKGGSGSEVQAVSSQTRTSTSSNKHLSTQSKLATLTKAELRALELPKAAWSDHLSLIKGLQWGAEGTEAYHCPNFDIDGNGIIENIESKDSSGKVTHKGDGAILAHALLSWDVGFGWGIPWTGSQHSGAGENATRGFPWPYNEYLNCLSGRYGGAKRLDVNADNKSGTVDAGIILGATSSKFVNIGKTKAQTKANEQLSQDLRICHGFFEYKTEANARSYQIQCKAGSATFQELPKLTTRAADNNRSCEFLSGNIVVIKLSGVCK